MEETLDLANLSGDIQPMPKRLSTVIRKLRESKDMNQVDLAKKSGVAQGYISDLEAGEKTNPGLDVLKKLARALGVPVTELLE